MREKAALQEHGTFRYGEQPVRGPPYKGNKIKYLAGKYLSSFPEKNSQHIQHLWRRSGGLEKLSLGREDLTLRQEKEKEGFYIQSYAIIEPGEHSREEPAGLEITMNDYYLFYGKLS